MVIQAIVNIAEICSQHAITQAVISPGSRSAVITLAFARHPDIDTIVVPDERSAGFTALGLAQSSGNPVVLICTSGTAAANFYPAVIEAYYQEVPLIVLTADRPPELIDQQDGQTIRQENLFRNHVRASFQFPDSFENNQKSDYAARIISEAIISATGKVKGPTHINIPVREPFYPSQEEVFHYNKSVKVIKSESVELQPTETQITEWIDVMTNHERIMLVAGQQAMSAGMTELLKIIQRNHKWVVVGDVISNIHGIEHAITHHDLILSDPEDNADLCPDLLVTFGNSVLSKKLKIFLRTIKPKVHRHIGENDVVVDTFNTLTNKVLIKPEIFLEVISRLPAVFKKAQNNYFNLWKEKDLQAKVYLDTCLSEDKMSEFHAVKAVLEKLPAKSNLHLANSMSVRYANYLGLNLKKEIAVWANRGTSGIDGCLSTAVGHAINTNEINTLITGDMAFFYDRNGLWHNHIPHNLRIIILNNHGGGIFSLIDGPKQLEEAEEFFVTDQRLNAANTARDFGLNYYSVKKIEALSDILDKFYDEKSTASILEIETDLKLNQEVFEDFIKQAARLWKPGK